MNYKKISFILLILLTLLLTVSVISAENITENTKESQNTSITNNTENTQITNTETSQPKIKTKIEAPQVAFKHKKSNYFKIKVEDRYDDDIPIKNIKLKLKIYTGSEYKTYTVKTNSHGIAKFNTKILGKGTHKVIISSEDNKYEISGKSKIYIGKEYSSKLKINKNKKLKTKDIVKVKLKNDDDEIEAKVVFVKKPKKTIITKAKFYLKKKTTGKSITVTDLCEFDDGKWELPDKDFSKKYRLVKVKLYYIKN
ncbi:MAG: hypothetical protein E7Z80_02395 [Methanobrevibacter thaueri]|nr:hypothetical protein [Methanobrevibacter thaueri]